MPDGTQLCVNTRPHFCPMNKNLLRSALGGVMSMALITGCESSRPMPAAIVPQAEAVISPPELPAMPGEIIRAAAVQPLVPVAGDGWRPLFDGSSFNGWRVTNFGVVGRVALQQ